MKKLLSIALTGAIALSAGAYYIAPAQQTSLTANAEKYQMLEYEIKDGTIRITGCLDVAKGEIIIPDSIDGMHVTVIYGNAAGFGAFYEKKYIESVVLPDTIKYIEDDAFSRCSLESISMQEGIKHIGSGAFRDNVNLKSVEIPDSVTSVGSNVFTGCSSLEKVTIGKGLKDISACVFSLCSSLKSIVIPENVESICVEAFDGCESLESITIENPYCDIEDAPDTISDTAIIYGYENSTAQAYAEIYGREFRLIGEDLPEIPDGTTETTETTKGDVNGDNSVTIADAVAILQYLANSDEYALSEQGLKNADVLGDDGVNTEDALQIQKLDAGVIDKL